MKFGMNYVRGGHSNIINVPVKMEAIYSPQNTSNHIQDCMAPQSRRP